MLVDQLKASARYYVKRANIQAGDALLEVLTHGWPSDLHGVRLIPPVPGVEGALNKVFTDPDKFREYQIKRGELKGILITAAGDGTRMQPFTHIRPKSMIEYPLNDPQGKPLIDYVLDPALRTSMVDIRDVVVMMKDSLEDKRLVHLLDHVKYKGVGCVHQKGESQKGYLRAVQMELYNNPEFAERMSWYDTLAIVPSDIVIDETSFNPWFQTHEGSDITLVMTDSDGFEEGNLNIKTKGNRITGFKPGNDKEPGYDLLKHTGVVIVNAELLHNPAKLAALYLGYSKDQGDLASRVVKIGFEYTENFKECNKPEDL